jgi:hypothetical protein
MILLCFDICTGTATGTVTNIDNVKSIWVQNLFVDTFTHSNKL